jgi:hypothetical protein
MTSITSNNEEIRKIKNTAHGPLPRLGENHKTLCNSDSSYNNEILFNGELAHPLKSTYREVFTKQSGTLPVDAVASSAVAYMKMKMKMNICV